MTEPVKSAKRVLELLECVTDERRSAAVGVIAPALGWPQSSTSVLLKGLAETGFFDHDGRSGLYAPDVRIAPATAWLQEHQFSEHNLLRLMEGALRQTGHTEMIGTRRGVQVRDLHGPQATLTEREVAMLLRKAHALEPDPADRVEFDAVRQAIARVRERGYAISMGTSMRGAAALAVLVPVARDREPMSLSVGGPMHEVQSEQQHLATVLRDAIEPLRRAISG